MDNRHGRIDDKGCCSTCGSKVSIRALQLSRSTDTVPAIVTECGRCEWKTTTPTSKETDEEKVAELAKMREHFAANHPFDPETAQVMMAQARELIAKFGRG